MFFNQVILDLLKPINSEVEVNLLEDRIFHIGEKSPVHLLMNQCMVMIQADYIFNEQEIQKLSYLIDNFHHNRYVKYFLHTP